MNLARRLLVCWLIGASLIACGPSEPEVNTEATIAAGVAATQTATAPTDTPTPPPTDTPAPTDTPTSSPTATPTPAPLAEPTTEAVEQTTLDELEEEGVVLEAEDLPPAFEALDPAEMGMSREAMSSEQFKVNSLFAFIEPQTFQIVMGFTTRLNTKLDQAGFDAGLRDPELLSESFISGLGATNILEQQELVLEDLGDEAGGLSIVADMAGVPMRVDVAVFRKEKVGAFVMMMYMEDEEVSITVEEVARKLANKIE